MSDLVSLSRLCPSAVDAVVRLPGSKMERFKEMVLKVLQDGISWEKIALLFYVAGKFAVKVSYLLPFSVCVTTVACWLPH